MATKRRRDLEISLANVVMPSLANTTHSAHLLSINLIWPRVSIALRTAIKPLDLSQGRCPAQAWPWCQRILFKETVEDCFGLSVSISEALSAHKLAQFGRFFAGSMLEIGEDIVEDALPGLAGDIAAIPLDYAAKLLLKTQEPDRWARGDIDLDSEQLVADGESRSIAIPLLATRSRVKTIVKRPRGKSAAPTRHEQQLIVAKNAPDGLVEIVLRELA